MLIVENGTGVANANSYVDLTYARTYATQSGFVLPVDDTELEVLLLNGMSFIESFKAKLQGHKVSSTQNLQFPRNLVFIDGYELANDEIPDNLKIAQVRAAVAISEGTDFFETVGGQLITEETVGPITTKYADEYLATIDGQPIYKTVTTFLEEFFIPNSGYRITARHGF